MITPPRQVYLDHAAATPLDPQVLNVMLTYLRGTHGNPSSMHRAGRGAHDALETARTHIAHTLGARADEIIFTGSGTESANLAILGVARALRERGRHLIVSAVEHKAVLSAARRLGNEGFSVTSLPVDARGRTDPEQCVRAIRPDTTLVSCMYANNEIGTVTDIRALVARIRSTHGAWPLIHTDACQAPGMLSIDTAGLGVDLMTLNSAKVYGPKGIGLLYVRRDVRIEPLITGGDQEHGLRAGTENVALAAGFAEALSRAETYRHEEAPRLRALRDRLIRALLRTVPHIIVTGARTRRLPNHVSFCVPEVEGESLVLLLDERGVSCATGSACAAGDLTPSHVLRAIGIPDEVIHGSVRLTLGRATTVTDIDYTVAQFAACVERLRTITPLTFLPYARS